MKTLCLQVFAAILLASCMSPWPPRPADLLFHVAATENAITAVTPGMIDHVAIVVSRDSVIEAVGKGVVTTPLDSLQKQKGYYLYARVRHADRQRSIANARRFLGQPYDSLYLPDNEAIYCSELVLLSFVNKRGKPIFQPVPMTFRDSTGQIPSHWLELYERNGIAVPEGEAGSNPAELSQRKIVKIVGKLL
ncbi:MAG: hypothetical protein IKN21_06960 [Prevotella sp.]|nr:hypothetical protein [Prevotella sp.]